MSVSQRPWERPLAGYVVAVALTAVVSGVIAIIRQFDDVSNISMLYLLAVLAGGALFGSGPAVLASIAAFVAFNVLFVEPHYHVTVADRDEWIALGLLLIAGIITGQLAAALGRRAREAERREREALVLYDAVRLLAEPEVETAALDLAERLRRELNLAAVLIDLSDDAPVAVRAEAGDRDALQLARARIAEPARLLAEGQAPTGVRRGSPGRWIKVVPPRSPRDGVAGTDRLRIVPVVFDGRRVGLLALVRAEGAPPLSAADDRLLSAVANQVRLALERARLREAATEAEVLRRTDELKSVLLSAVSHDLRTPLSSIIASAGSLLQRDVPWSEDERREFAAAIEQEANRLNRLVGNLLDLSRIEAGSLRPEKGWYDLPALIEEVLGRLRPLLGRHAVAVDIAGDLPPLLLDYVEIDEVLSNLLENAAKYTPPGSDISVSARREGGEVSVEVVDSGPGVPPAALLHLFEPFYRAPQSGTRAKGTGLGLAVASGLVRAHGGRIRAENRPEGGARFVFTLPIELASEPQADDAVSVPARPSEPVR